MTQEEKDKMIEVPQESDTILPRNITEEDVSKVQNQFENRLQPKNLSAPDSLSGKEIYIYSHLMRVWYNKLINENCNDDVLVQKFRTNWLDYLSALEDRGWYDFLTMDENDDGMIEFYRCYSLAACEKIVNIENTFAEAISKEAAEELKHTRAKYVASAFSREGHMAPDGYEYNIDYIEIPILKQKPDIQADSVTSSDDQFKISQLQNFYDRWNPVFKNNKMNSSYFLDMRQELAKIPYNENGLKNLSLLISAENMRKDFNKQTRPQIVGLAEKDTDYSLKIKDIILLKQTQNKLLRHEI